jgi:undecaprenyl-diphosphatase
MNWLEALILGIIQGLTEFLPVSSSGHLEIGKALLGIEPSESLSFSIVVHGATVLSTIVVFRNDLWELIKGVFQFKWNWETRYVAMILLSMLPVLVVGAFFKDTVEGFFRWQHAFRRCDASGYSSTAVF